MGIARQRGVHMAIGRGGGGVTGAENNSGKLCRVWGFGGGLFLEAPHLTFPWNQLDEDKGG